MTSSRLCATCADIPQLTPRSGAIFRVREVRRNEIRPQPSVDSQAGETKPMQGGTRPLGSKPRRRAGSRKLHKAGARSVGFVYILSLTARLWAFPALASIALSGAVGEDGRDAR